MIGEELFRKEMIINESRKKLINPRQGVRGPVDEKQGKKGECVMNGQSEQKRQRPVKEFKAGGVSAAVWCNEKEVDGRIVTNHSVRIQKSFFDKGFAGIQEH